MGHSKRPSFWYHELDNMYATVHRKHKRDKWYSFLWPPSLNLSHVSIKNNCPYFAWSTKRLVWPYWVESKTLIVLRDSRSITYTYHQFNDLLSGMFVCDIHCGKENGHVDVDVLSHNSINITKILKTDCCRSSPQWRKIHISSAQQFVERVICICLAIVTK